jgi:hypothetical protein
MLLFILSETGIGLDGRTLFDGTGVLPDAKSWSSGWHVLPGAAKWNASRLDAMVAWKILYIFIGTAVLVGLVGPTTFTLSFHFCIYSAQEICRGKVQPYPMVWPYHKRLLQQNLLNFRPLHLKDFIYYLFIYLELRLREKNNYCDETQLKRKERKLVGTYLDGDLSPPSWFQERG